MILNKAVYYKGGVKNEHHHINRIHGGHLLFSHGALICFYYREEENKMHKVNKHTVLKQARNNGHWSGYIAGNKVSEYHIANGWNLGYDVEIKAVQSEGTWIYTVNADQTLDQFINAFLYYLPRELGNTVSFWAED